MKTYISKVIVKLKPNIVDIKGDTLKRAIESFIEVQNLSCRIGTSYLLQFEAENQVVALNLVEKIASELLTNDIVEIYEIKTLEEV